MGNAQVILVIAWKEHKKCGYGVLDANPITDRFYRLNK